MALFEKGNPGRQKGSKNKFKLSTIQDALKEAKLDLGPLILEEIMAVPNALDRITLLLRLYTWVEPRVQKIENIGARSSENPTGLEKRVDGHLLEILQPERINGTNGRTA